MIWLRKQNFVPSVELTTLWYESFPYSCLLYLTYRSPRMGNVTVFYSFDTTNIWYVTKQLGKWTQRFSVVCLSPPGLPCQEMTSPYSFSLNCCCVSSKTSFSCVIIIVSIQQNVDFVGLVYQMSLKPLLPIFQKSRLLMSTLPKQQHWSIEIGS